MAKVEEDKMIQDEVAALINEDDDRDPYMVQIEKAEHQQLSQQAVLETI